MTRYGYMRKVPCTKAKVEITGIYGEDGSVLAGTLRSWCESVRIRLEVETVHGREETEEMVRLAWNGCWTVQALLKPVDVDYELNVVHSEE